MSAQVLETSSLTRLHWLAIGLATITGVIHVGIGIQFSDPLLLLAGLGFFGAIVLALFDVKRRLLYLVGIPYTAIQLVMYFVRNWPNVISPAGVVDKIVQVSLIVVLYMLYRQQ